MKVKSASFLPYRTKMLENKPCLSMKKIVTGPFFREGEADEFHIIEAYLESWSKWCTYIALTFTLRSRKRRPSWANRQKNCPTAVTDSVCNSLIDAAAPMFK